MCLALFTISDLHLSLSADKPMDIFKGWENYVQRLESNWRNVVGQNDTVVLPGDISWAMKLEDTKADFTFLHNLPGKKIILKGNHDYWWSTISKMREFVNAQGWYTIDFVHNSAVKVGNVAVCGTRGWFYEHKGTDKIILREAMRLEASIKAAKAVGGEPVVFLHYPPVSNKSRVDAIMNVLIENNIKRCYYGHIHTYRKSAHMAFSGEKDGIIFTPVSCDIINFTPVKIAQ